MCENIRIILSSVLLLPELFFPSQIIHYIIFDRAIKLFSIVSAVPSTVLKLTNLELVRLQFPRATIQAPKSLNLCIVIQLTTQSPKRS